MYEVSHLAAPVATPFVLARALLLDQGGEVSRVNVLHSRAVTGVGYVGSNRPRTGDIVMPQAGSGARRYLEEMRALSTWRSRIMLLLFGIIFGTFVALVMHL